jgi:hypothetical protein
MKAAIETAGRTRAGLSPTTETPTWTCVRCDVTARFMADSDHDGPPADWVELDGELYCLGCRRVLAGDAAAEAEEAAGATREQLLQLRKVGTLEFEIRRDPDRPDRAIARACRTSVPAVAKVRRRLA